MNPPVVVDTNILFAALVSRRSSLRETPLMEASVRYCSPRFIFTELFKHKERILAATDLSEDELLEAMSALFSRLSFEDEGAITLGDWIQARRLCAEVVDEKDTPFVALDHPSACVALDRRRRTQTRPPCQRLQSLL